MVRVTCACTAGCRSCTGYRHPPYLNFILIPHPLPSQHGQNNLPGSPLPPRPSGVRVTCACTAGSRTVQAPTHLTFILIPCPANIGRKIYLEALYPLVPSVVRVTCSCTAGSRSCIGYRHPPYLNFSSSHAQPTWAEKSCFLPFHFNYFSSLVVCLWVLVTSPTEIFLKSKQKGPLSGGTLQRSGNSFASFNSRL